MRRFAVAADGTRGPPTHGPRCLAAGSMRARGTAIPAASLLHLVRSLAVAGAPSAGAACSLEDARTNRALATGATPKRRGRRAPCRWPHLRADLAPCTAQGADGLSNHQPMADPEFRAAGPHAPGWTGNSNSGISALLRERYRCRSDRFQGPQTNRQRAILAAGAPSSTWRNPAAPP